MTGRSIGRLAIGLPLVLAACSSGAGVDAGPPAGDGGPGDARRADGGPPDAGLDGGPDAGRPDGARDAGELDGGRDAGGDAGEDAGFASFYGMGIGADALDNQQVADMDYRFRAATSSQLQSLIWYDIYDPYCTPHGSTDAGTCPEACGKSGSVYACGTGGVMHICVVTDDDGASHLATTTELGCVDDSAPSARPALHQETFPSPPLLAAGQLYHLHWHNTDPTPLVNFTSVDALWVRQATVPRQPTVSDLDLAVFRGTTLRPADTPLFQLGYADGTVQGQGYLEVWSGAPAAISGVAQVREQFTVSGGDRTVHTVSVRLNRASGSSALGVRLETGAGTAIEQGSVAATAIPLGDVASQSPTWATYSFSTPRVLADGQSYHLVLSAPADTVYQAYGVERGNGYGFVPPTFFGDGDGQFNPDGGLWRGFTQPGGRLDNPNADVQFYFGP